MKRKEAIAAALDAALSHDKEEKAHALRRVLARVRPMEKDALEEISKRKTELIELAIDVGLHKVVRFLRQMGTTNGEIKDALVKGKSGASRIEGLLHYVRVAASVDETYELDSAVDELLEKVRPLKSLEKVTATIELGNTLPTRYVPRLVESELWSETWSLVENDFDDRRRERLLGIMRGVEGRPPVVADPEELRLHVETETDPRKRLGLLLDNI